MSKKPPYEELEQRVRKLEKEASERKLLEDELILKSIVFEMSIAANSTADNEGVINYVNPTFLKMWGYDTKEEAIGNSVPYFFQNADDAIPVLEALDKSGFWRGEFKAKRKDGSIFISRGLASVVRDDAGHQIGYYSANIDVTDHKQAEDALRLQSEIAVNMSEGVYLIRVSDGAIIYTNPRFEEIFGYGSGEMVDKHVSIVNAPTEMTPEETVDHIVGTMKQTATWQGEVQNIKKDGTPFWCYASASMFEHPEYGEIIISVHTDIDQRKRAEEALRESEERFRLTYENAPLGYQSLDENGRFIDVNQAWIDVLGYSRQEVIGKSFADFLDPEWADHFRENFPRFKAVGEILGVEFDMIKKDGSTMTVSINGKIGRDEKGDFRQTHCILHDITHKKQAEEVLRKAHEELEKKVEERTTELSKTNTTLEKEIEERKQAEAEREALIKELEVKNAELEQFTYTVSHDLKAPLITITGFLGMLKKDAAKGDAERMKADMERISGAAVKMGQLLSDLLELSRIGRVVGPREKLAFVDVARAGVSVAEGRLKARGVKVEIDPSLPTVHGDSSRLQLVVENLVDNAAKYMGAQPLPLVKIGCRRDADQRVFYVMDNGVGIDSEYHGKIFGLFDRLDQQTEGTGVGLAIVKRIVEVHGGRIWVESEPSKGSTFCFTLPAQVS